VKAALSACAATLALLAVSCSPPESSARPELLAPHLGTRVDLPIEEPGHSLGLDLPRDRWLRLVVRQRGVDVTVRVTDPAGHELLIVDSPSGRLGREPVAFLTAADGVHHLHLETGGSGDVTVEVLESRQAAREDALRAEATRVLSRGTFHWIEDEHEAAEAELRRALDGFRQVGGDPAENDARRWLAAAVAADGRLEEATTLLLEAAVGFLEQREAHEEAKTRTELGALWWRLGESAEAERAFLRARDLFTADGNETDLALVLNHLGLLWSDLGRLAEAETALEEALRLRESHADTCAVSSTERSLGTLYALIGRDREALDFLESAVAHAAASCEPSTRVSAEIELGWAHFLTGHGETALAHLDAAVELAREEQVSRPLLAALDRRGTVLASMGRYRDARTNYHHALHHAEATGDLRSQGDVLANLGRLTRLAGDTSTSLRYLRRALPLLTRAEDAEAEAFSRLEMARGLRSLGEEAAAEDQLVAALGKVEAVRAGLPSTASRSFFLAHRREIYDELIDLLMQRAASDAASDAYLRALEVSERARARSLLDSVAQSVSAAPAASTAALQSLMATIADLDDERARLRDSSAPPQQVRAVGRRLRRLALVAERLASPPPQPVERLLTADEIAEVLDQETDLLVFSLGGSASYAWLVGASGDVRWFRLPPGPTLEGLARRAASELARSRIDTVPFPASRATTALARELLGPIVPHLDAPRLAVVPDGALHLVPLQALPIANEAGELLLDRLEIVLIPSPSALAEQRARPAPDHPREIFVVADPVYSAADHRLGAKAEVATASRPADLERSLDALDLDSLPRLWATRREARTIFAASRGGSELLVDFAADRQRVLASPLAEYRALHFATHAILHPTHPQLSGVVLSLVGPDGRARDGFLRAWEIASLKAPAELVVLSACSTGLGREVRAEGLIGLPQAFFRAGARRVVVSHWPVQDSATARLMGTFYEGLLRENLPPATALAHAQRQLRADPRWTQPYFWAGFSLQGDWRPLAGQQSRP
jgi:CHAT domain-containing protein/tetratricopeptide (TPR) repeat protein